MAGFRTYDPKAYVVSIGALILGGFAPDKWLSAKRKTALFTSTAGASGEVARSKMNDARGEIEFTTLASSATNDVLSALVLLDDESGQGVGPFQLADLNGTTLLHAPNAWIVGYPDTELAKEIGEVPWKIECDVLAIFRGGKSPLGGIG
jgi:hypothetical protein